MVLWLMKSLAATSWLQFGIVLPEHHACVSVMAHYLGPTTHILDCVWEHIVPTLA
jgi:hypothetical protein